jgi:hypothetical protein
MVITAHHHVAQPIAPTNVAAPPKALAAGASNARNPMYMETIAMTKTTAVLKVLWDTRNPLSLQLIG